MLKKSLKYYNFIIISLYHENINTRLLIKILKTLVFSKILWFYWHFFVLQKHKKMKNYVMNKTTESVSFKKYKWKITPFQMTSSSEFVVKQAFIVFPTCAIMNLSLWPVHFYKRFFIMSNVLLNTCWAAAFLWYRPCNRVREATYTCMYL